ncbi:MAG: hypothetical protein AAFX99_10195 [Myxococcota bacterium]
MGAVSDYLERSEHSHADELLHLTLEQKAALLEVIGLAVYADGVAAVEELEVVFELIREIPAFAQYTEHELDGLLNRGLDRLRGAPHAPDKVYAQLAARLPTTALREAAFGLAAVVCLADGIVVHLERDVLKGLLIAFGLPRERTVEIVREARAFVAE